MINKSSANTNKILWILLIFFILLFGALSVGYVLYQNLPGAPITLEPVVIKAPVIENQTFEDVKQFYSNMKFNHNQISYNIDSLCSDEKKQRMIEAFDSLSRLVGNIIFYRVSNMTEEVDIEISCSEQEKFTEEEYFIAGEGGAKEIVSTGRYNIISSGMVLLHDSFKRVLECDWANVELHELIHVFGFGHSENPDSLMYSILENCDQKLDEAIIEELKRLYSEENLPDLYFESVSAVKRRRRLDFNLTVRNLGAIDAENVEFSVLDEGEIVSTFDLKDKDGKIKYGAGIIISVTDLPLKHVNPDEISFIIDYENSIEEIDKENNVAKITFD